MMTKQDLSYLERFFAKQKEILGNLADKEQFEAISELFTEIHRLKEENSKLTELNRHYFHHFFDGKIDKMKETFKYLME